MKYFTLFLLLFFFFSCKNKQNENSDIVSLGMLGNWSSYQDKSYYEYFFTENYMYTYNPNAGSVFQYDYVFRQDSIFLHDTRPEFKDEPYNYYDKVLKTDSLEIILETKSLIRIKGTNTLESFVNKEIDHKTFDTYGKHRQNLVIPLDSLLKWSGESINLDNLDKY